MEYAIEILLEQKILIESELVHAKGEERNNLERRLIDTAVALNKLNETQPQTVKSLDGLNEEECPYDIIGDKRVQKFGFTVGYVERYNQAKTYSREQLEINRLKQTIEQQKEMIEKITKITYDDCVEYCQMDEIKDVLSTNQTNLKEG